LDLKITFLIGLAFLSIGIVTMTFVMPTVRVSTFDVYGVVKHSVDSLEAQPLLVQPLGGDDAPGGWPC